MTATAELTRRRIDLAALGHAAPVDGAVCLFTGVVRNHHQGRAVLRLEYEAYEEMALEQLRRVAEEARERFGVTSVRVVHRLGPMEVGETSVAVAAASPHRQQAFEACRFAIDTLKARVPIWKKEFYADGAVWLEEPGKGATPVGAGERG